MEKNEVLDLTDKIFKKHGVFLLSMYKHNNSTLTDLSKKSKIQYKYLFEIVKYFEGVGIVKKYPIGKGRDMTVCLTPVGVELVNALVNPNYRMKRGKRLKKPGFNDEGVVMITYEEYEELKKDGRRRKKRRR